MLLLVTTEPCLASFNGFECNIDLVLHGCLILVQLAFCYAPKSYFRPTLFDYETAAKVTVVNRYNLVNVSSHACQP